MASYYEVRACKCVCNFFFKKDSFVDKSLNRCKLIVHAMIHPQKMEAVG